MLGVREVPDERTQFPFIISCDVGKAEIADEIRFFPGSCRIEYVQVLIIIVVAVNLERQFAARERPGMTRQEVDAERRCVGQFVILYVLQRQHDPEEILHRGDLVNLRVDERDTRHQVKPFGRGPGQFYFASIGFGIGIADFRERGYQAECLVILVIVIKACRIQTHCLFRKGPLETDFVGIQNFLFVL